MILRPAPTFRLLLAGGALAILLTGCASLPLAGLAGGPAYVPTNVHGPAQWPLAMRRVAVLPVHDATGRLTPEFTAAYDPIWLQALDHSHRAEFVVLDRRTLASWTGRETLASTDALPAGLLEHLARETGAEAVIFLDLTHCAAYPPLGLGFRAKLVVLPATDILWAADELFDSADAAVTRAAEAFGHRNARGPGDPASAVLKSPSTFAAYAFQAVTDLLPPRLAPAPAH